MDEHLRRTVKDTNAYIRAMVDSKTLDKSFLTSGIVSRHHISDLGHEYFQIGEKGYSIDCMVPESVRSNLNRSITNGSEVEVFGHIAVYEKLCRVQIMVEKINVFSKNPFHPDTETVAHLEQLGLWPPQHKSLPKNPSKIALITSKSSEGKQDFENTYREEQGKAAIQLYETFVQGERAPDQIAQAIERINREKNTDVIVIVRSGGRKTELAVFNNIKIVEAICRSNIPVITGIGHTQDDTFADQVADFAAITPTSAAVKLAKLSKTEPPSQVQTHLQLNWIIYAIGITIIVLLLFLIAQSL